MKRKFTTLCFVLVYSFSMYSMQFFVQLPSGSSIRIDAEGSDTVEAIEAKIQDITGTSPECQNLFYDNIRLAESQTLIDYNITANSIVILTLKSQLISNKIPDQTTVSNQVFNFTLPSNTFYYQPNTLNASLLNNVALPNWLTFTPETMTFSGTPTQSGIINIVVSSTSACNDQTMATDTFKIDVQSIPTDIALNSNNKLTYNSSNSKFTLSSNKSDFPINYYLYSTTGLILKKGTITCELSISELPAGIYFLYLLDNSVKKQLKFIKQ